MASLKVNKTKSDRGDSIVSAVFMVLLVAGILFTMLDGAIYFLNKSNIQAVARDSARSVGMMGGDGTSSLATAMEVQYGQRRSIVCDPALAQDPVVKEAYAASLSNIECNALGTISRANNLINVKVSKVDCGVDVSGGSFTGARPTLMSKSTAINQRTMCFIDWKYQGIPGSTLGFIKKPGPDGRVSLYSDGGLFANNTNVGTGETEVNLKDVDLMRR